MFAACANARTKSSSRPVSNPSIVSYGTGTSCTTKLRPARSRKTSTAASSSGTVMRREPPDARLVAERLGERGADRDAAVLDGVVAVDLQVALARDVEVPPGVLAELLQHVVEERDAGVGVDDPPPSRSSSTVMSVSFVVRVTLAVALAVRLMRTAPLARRRGTGRPRARRPP